MASPSTAGICGDGTGKGKSDKNNYENMRKEKNPLPGSLLKPSYNKKQEPQTTFAVKATNIELIFIFLHNILC